jgi:nucleoside-diphosphate-sugar epimerase
MIVAVTGATGLTGSCVADRLAAADHEVVVLARNEPARLAPGARWVQLDLTRPLNDALPARVDAVVHLAQSRRYREWPEGAADVFEINAAATARLADWCRRAGGTRFVYASSGAVYGAGSAPKHEDEVPAPGNFYARSKLAGELAALGFCAELAVSALRFFFIYGPGQRDMFVPGIAARVRGGEPVTLAGEDGIAVNPVYVSDAADAVVAAATAAAGAGAVNVAGPEVVSLRALAQLIGEQVGAAPWFEQSDPAPDVVADITRMRERLHVPAVGVGEGLARTLRSPG